MKTKILNILAITSFSLGILFAIILLIQINYSGYKFQIHYINLENSNKIAAIFQGVVGTVWLITTISLLFLTIEIQKKELRETSQSLRQQNEDTHFFNLLNTFNLIRNQIEISVVSYQSLSSLDPGEYKENKYTGNRYFQNIYSLYIMFTEVLNPTNDNQEKTLNYLDQLNQVFGITIEKINSLKKLIIYDSSPAFYGSVSAAYFGLLSSDLGNYYNLLIQIIRYSERSLSMQIYMNYLKSVLSRDEIGLFFYFGLTDFNKLQYLSSINFFDSIENIDLIDNNHQIFYKLK